MRRARELTQTPEVRKATSLQSLQHPPTNKGLLGKGWTENQRHHFANKGPYSQGYGFPSGHVWM